MSITTQTRWDSFEKLDKKRLHHLIISALAENSKRGLTAREVAVILYNQGYVKSNERQATAPRLTELVDAGKAVVIGKRLDEISLKQVAVYSIANINSSKEKAIDETIN